jgi:hypothetical protein
MKLTESVVGLTGDENVYMEAAIILLELVNLVGEGD